VAKRALPGCKTPPQRALRRIATAHVLFIAAMQSPGLVVEPVNN